MIKTKLGLYEKALHDQLTLEHKCLLAKQAGFDFLELSIDENPKKIARLDWNIAYWKNLKQKLDENNFKINSLCLSAHRKFALGSNDNSLVEKGLEIFEKALKLCLLLDIKIIQLAGYDVYYEPSTDETKNRFLKNLKAITKKAKEVNVLLGIETMDTPFLGTASKVRYYVDLINSPYLQIYPDMGNLFQWTNNPKKDLNDNVNYFVQMHLKATLPNVFRDLPWEQSNVPYTDLLKVLVAKKYNKYFLAEMWAANDVEFDYEKEMKRLCTTYAFLKEKLNNAGYELC